MFLEENSALPPLTNRGVPYTSESGLNACVDWLQVTLKKIENEKNIFALLGLDETHFKEVDGGLYGWKTTFQTEENEIRIFVNSEQVEGSHLMISGKGCRYFEKHSTTNWVNFFGVIQNTDVNYKRIDIALDDFKGYYNPSKVYRKIKQNAVTSTFRRGRWIESFEIGDYKKGGTTIYLGSPKSEIQVRIYDKYLERQEKGFIVDENIKTWVRTEIQLRDERAEAVALMIANDYKSLGGLASGILKKYITFRVVNKKESNRSRWKVCKWWADFLGDVEAISLTLHHEEPYLEKSIDWANKQWLKTMYSMYMVFEQDIDIFYKLMEKGQANMENRDYKRIKKFVDTYGNISFDEYLEKKKKELKSDNSSSF